MGQKNYSVSPKTFVYFIEGCGTGLVKIGTTNNVDERLRAVRTHCPTPIKLLATIEAWGAMRLEGALHERLARHRSHGEWYRLEGEVLEFISAAEAITAAARGLAEEDAAARHDEFEAMSKAQLLRFKEPPPLTPPSFERIMARVRGHLKNAA